MNVAPSRRWPLGLLGTLALMLGVEFGLTRRDRQLTALFPMEWKEINHTVKVARGSAIIAMGDSLVKNGVLPREVERHLGPGRTVYNLSASGCPLPGVYALFRRLIESGQRPEAILVDSHHLGFPLHNPVYPPPWHQLLGVRELAEMAWAVRDANFAAENLARKALASMRHRAALRSNVAAALSGKPVPDMIHLWYYLLAWNRNKGCLLLADFETPPDPNGVRYDPGMLGMFRGPWKCDRDQGEYAERLLTLAAKANVRVYMLMMPDEAMLNALRERDGWWDAHAAYLRGLQGRHPNLFVIDGHRSPYPAEAMRDVLHLSRTGAIAFSNALGTILGDADPASRWIMLPSYDPARAKELAARSPALDVDRMGRVIALKDQGPGATALR